MNLAKINLVHITKIPSLDIIHHENQLTNVCKYQTKIKLITEITNLTLLAIFN